MKNHLFLKQKKKGISIIPRDSLFFNLINKLAKKNSKTVFSFGSHEDADFRLIKSSKISRNLSALEFDLLGKQIKVKTQNHSKHHHMNILVILIIAKLLKIDQSAVIQKIYKLKPIIGRGSIHKIQLSGKKLILLDESYNSNPISLKVSLDNLNNISTKKSRKICVIGDMLELGKNSLDLHREIVDSILSNKVDIVFTIGKYTKIINENLPNNLHSKHFDDIQILYNNLSSILLDNDIILIKGSNSMNLNQICVKLKRMVS